MYYLYICVHIHYNIQGVIKRYRQISHGGWGGVQKCQKNSPGGRRRFSWELRGVKGVRVPPCRSGNLWAPRQQALPCACIPSSSPPANAPHCHSRSLLSFRVVQSCVLPPIPTSNV